VFLVRLSQRVIMDLDALLQHYFGTTDLDSLDDEAIDRGAQWIRLSFGTESDAGRRFALWVVLHSLGDAPDPRTAFKDPREREAAEEYARAMDRAERAPD
jgi:hypothetical protein